MASTFHSRVVVEEEVIQQQPAPQYQNLIIQHMDIAEPLSTLKQLLELRLQCSLAEHQFFLQDSIPVSVVTCKYKHCLNAFHCSWRNLHIFRPVWIDYINLSKFLDNYLSRCKCTGGDSRGGIFFSLKKILVCFGESSTCTYTYIRFIQGCNIMLQVQ